MRDANELETDLLSSGFAALEIARFRVRTLAEAEALAGLLARLFPEPARVLPGLHELLRNAIEHGSLEIGHDLKGVLLAQDDLEAEIDRRQRIEPYASRSVVVEWSRRPGGCGVAITDEGPGFDWRAFLRIDPARASAPHGRGIARARAQSFDRIAFSAKGDRVAAFVKAGA